MWSALSNYDVLRNWARDFFAFGKEKVYGSIP